MASQRDIVNTLLYPFSEEARKTRIEPRELRKELLEMGVSETKLYDFEHAEITRDDTNPVEKCPACETQPEPIQCPYSDDHKICFACKWDTFNRNDINFVKCPECNRSFIYDIELGVKGPQP